ncbi:MAG: hypothetical protein H6824_02140 [Planctomycetaceae bacterium]|nr:hypothetical protein [Planctomycetaceae bacterium]
MSHPIATIDVRIRTVQQLFNSLDATPFPDTDLDAEAEEFILSWAREFRSDALFRIRIHVEHLPSEDHYVQNTEAALNGFFAYRADVLKRRLHQLLARGRVSMIIGLACLAASVVGANLVGQFGDATLVFILRESLIIGGWVAMWRPLEILLYDWWPLRQERIICERLACAQVELVEGWDT